MTDSVVVSSNESKTYLVGHPGGLCNRLDVITTGHLLARHAGGSRIDLLWPIDDIHMPVSFHELFTELPHGRVVEGEIAPTMVADYFAMAAAALPSNYRESASYRKILSQLLSKVVPEVQLQVEEFAQQYFRAGTKANQSVIGIHVRRTERPMPICEFAQPLRYYEAIMKSFPADTRFFISTDAQEAFHWLQHRFGGRVFQRPKMHDHRRSLAGVREGLVDMLLLSRCNAVVATLGSSFSHLAAFAGGRPVLTLKAIPKVSKGWPAFSPWRWAWAYRHFLVEATFWRVLLCYVIRPQAIRIPQFAARLRRNVLGGLVKSAANYKKAR